MERIVKGTANIIIRNHVAEEQQLPVLTFGIETAIYKILHLGVTVLIGILLGRVLEIVVFHLFYIKLRTYAGGHHAKSNIGCLICSCGIAVGVLAFWYLCPLEHITLFTVVFLAASIPIIWFLAPVEASNKPLDEVETQVYRKKARTFLTIEIIVIVVLHFIGFCEIAFVGATSLLVLTIMLLLGKFKRRNDSWVVN